MTGSYKNFILANREMAWVGLVVIVRSRHAVQGEITVKFRSIAILGQDKAILKPYQSHIKAISKPYIRQVIAKSAGIVGEGIRMKQDGKNKAQNLELQGI